MKTCDYQNPNCFLPTYFMVDSEKHSTSTGVLNFFSHWFPYMIHKVLLSCISLREGMSLYKMIYRMFSNFTILF